MCGKMRENRRPPLVGITGGMGAGKTQVAHIFTECGAAIIDADQIGHTVLADNKEICARIVERFGEDVRTTHGDINRRQLGALVFADRQAMEDLNAIMHPVMIRLIARRVVELGQSGEYSMIAVDAALLYEAAVEDSFDAILAVSAPEALRVQRCMERTGLPEDVILDRLRLQLPESEKVRRADFHLDNNGTPKALQEAATNMFHHIQQVCRQEETLS